jgi:membrane protein
VPDLPSAILYFGAEFTQVYADMYGSRIVAAEGAEPVTDEARAEQGIPRAGKPRAEPPGRKN